MLRSPRVIAGPATAPAGHPPSALTDVRNANPGGDDPASPKPHESGSSHAQVSASPEPTETESPPVDTQDDRNDQGDGGSSGSD